MANVDDDAYSKEQVEELYYENGLLKHRSKENRQRCMNLEAKCARLEKNLNNQSAMRAKQEKLHAEAIQDMESQLKNAIDVIARYKGLLETSQKDRLRLMDEHNQRLAEVQILKEKLFRTGSFYDQCLEELARRIEENERLRLVNAKFVEELRKRDL